MDVTSIADMSVAMSQNQLMTDVGIALLDKALDQFEENGDQITKMMEASVTPNLGQNIDIRL